MSETISLDIEKRSDLNPRQVRAEGNLPAVVYGKDMDSVSVQLDRRNFVNSYKNNKDAVYKLQLGKKSYSTKVQNLQYNYATNEELHIEFLVV